MSYDLQVWSVSRPELPASLPEPAAWGAAGPRVRVSAAQPHVPSGVPILTATHALKTERPAER
jgi:hypothetical protein